MHKITDKIISFIPEADIEFNNYIRDLRWAQKFALLNREEMMDRVGRCVYANLWKIAPTV